MECDIIDGMSDLDFSKSNPDTKPPISTESISPAIKGRLNTTTPSVTWTPNWDMWIKPHGTLIRNNVGSKGGSLPKGRLHDSSEEKLLSEGAHSHHVKVKPTRLIRVRSGKLFASSTYQFELLFPNAA